VAAVSNVLDMVSSVSLVQRTHLKADRPSRPGYFCFLRSGINDHNQLIYLPYIGCMAVVT
jgi:hypothetical protein